MEEKGKKIRVSLERKQEKGINDTILFYCYTNDVYC